MTTEFNEVPVNRFLGYALVDRSAERSEITLAVRPEFVQEEGVVQGGIISALADTTAVYLFLPDLTPEQSMTSIEFKVNFLRPARSEAGDLHAVATVVRRGKSVAVCRVDVQQDGQCIATGLFTYLFFQRN